MTTPTFCNELAWMTWKVRDQVEVVYNCCWRVWRIMYYGKGCDREQINCNGSVEGSEQVFWKLPDTCDVRDLQLLVVMQSGWMTVKPAVYDMVLVVHTLSKKKVVGDCLPWWRKPEPDSGSTQYNTGPSRIASEHTLQWTLFRYRLDIWQVVIMFWFLSVYSSMFISLWL